MIVKLCGHNSKIDYPMISKFLGCITFDIPTRLSKFKNHNAALASGDWKTAAVEGRDSRWYQQVTNRAERLMSRLENV